MQNIHHALLEDSDDDFVDTKVSDVESVLRFAEDDSNVEILHY